MVVYQPSLYYCLLGEIYRYNALFMVDWQFAVFCRKVGFVVIYAFLVQFFVAKYATVLFKSLFATLKQANAFQNIGQMLLILPV